MSITDVLTIASAYIAAAGASGAMIGMLWAVYLAIARRQDFRAEAPFWVMIGTTVGSFIGLCVGVPVAIASSCKAKP